MAIGIGAMAAMSLAPMLLKGILGGRGRGMRGRGRGIRGRGRGLRGGKRKSPRRHEVKRHWVKEHTRHRRVKA